jgi:hypothetical protein
LLAAARGEPFVMAGVEKSSQKFPRAAPSVGTMACPASRPCIAALGARLEDDDGKRRYPGFSRAGPCYHWSKDGRPKRKSEK